MDAVVAVNSGCFVVKWGEQRRRLFDISDWCLVDWRRVSVSYAEFVTDELRNMTCAGVTDG